MLVISAHLIAVLFGPGIAFPQPRAAAELASRDEVVTQVGQTSAQVSTRFIENAGQWPENVRYLARLPGLLVRAECGAIVFDQPDSRSAGRGVLVRLLFEGSSQDAWIEGEQRLPGRYSFFFGNDPIQWRADVPSFAVVRYHELYPGIDLLVHSADRGVKYDLLISPRADLSRVKLRCEGIRDQWVEASQWSVDAGAGVLAQLPARCYELLPSGEARDIQCLWKATGDGALELEVPGRDPALALVVDPELLWSTYLGSSYPNSTGDFANAVAYDPNGNVVVVGDTSGPGFPQTPGAYQYTPTSSRNIFATKFRQTDGTLIYSSVFGGSTANQRPYAVAVGQNGAATVVGWTVAADFPTTPGAFDRVNNSLYAGFVTQLSPAGNALVFSTFLEDPQGAMVLFAVQVDATGHVVVGGGGVVPSFPTTAGAFQRQYQGVNGDALVVRLDPTGSSLDWSTLLGGTNAEGLYGLTLDASGDVIVAGKTTSDDFPTTPGAFQNTRIGWPAGFVTRLSSQGDSLVWSSYLGGASEVYLGGVAIDWLGAVYVGGYSKGAGFPVTPGAFQTQNPVPPGQNDVSGVLTKFDPSGQSLVYSTYFAGPSGSGVGALWVDPSGVVTLGAGGAGVPVTPGAYDTTFYQGGDAVIARMSPQGNRLFYSTYIGGPSTDGLASVTSSPTGRVTGAGYCYLPGGWPTTPNSYQQNYIGGQTDAVVVTLDLDLQGVDSHGESIPSCHGPLISNATEMPVAGSSSFALYCSGAPPLASGWLLVSVTQPHLTQVGGTGAGSVLGLARPWARIAVTADAAGYVETNLPLAANWTGRVFHCQYLFANTPYCNGPRRYCTTNPVTITVQ